MLLDIKDLWGGYGKQDIVKGVSCHADPGEILCLVGPNGCGKTTLFRLILGFLAPSHGSICIDGKPTSNYSPKEMANLVAYIPQHHSAIFSYTALDIVIMGRASHFSALESPKQPDRDAAFSALDKLEIADLANKQYMSLSGGQRQLVLVARAICQSASILVMDEPGASLDYANQKILMEVICELADKGYCVIMSTHSPEHPLSVGHKVMLMREGRLSAFGSPSKVITPDSLEEVYGIEMDVASIKDRYGTARTICLPVKKPRDGRDSS